MRTQRRMDGGTRNGHSLRLWPFATLSFQRLWRPTAPGNLCFAVNRAARRTAIVRTAQEVRRFLTAWEEEWEPPYKYRLRFWI